MSIISAFDQFIANLPSNTCFSVMDAATGVAGALQRNANDVYETVKQYCYDFSGDYAFNQNQWANASSITRTGDLFKKP